MYLLRLCLPQCLCACLLWLFAWLPGCLAGCMHMHAFQAWVLGALQSDSPRPFYWAAALYSLPLLRNGLDQDWFSLSLLLLGVLHMQVGVCQYEARHGWVRQRVARCCLIGVICKTRRSSCCGCRHRQTGLAMQHHHCGGAYCGQ